MEKWIFASLFAAASLHAGIQLSQFKNESEWIFNPTFCNGTPILGALLGQGETCVATADDAFMVVFEDAGLSGYSHPQWKLNVWLESDEGFPLFSQNRILYAVVFYDGEAELSVRWDSKGKLHLTGGKGVKDILLPWAKGTIGRGNPYHEIQGVEADANGIRYYDYQGFVCPGLPEILSSAEN